MGKRKHSESFFWTSYSDLMTSLFFIMLVLFVFLYIRIQSDSYRATELENDLKNKESQLKEANATVESLKKITQIEETFKELNNSSSLIYKEEKKIFVAKELEGIEIFDEESDVIRHEHQERVDRVGNAIEQLLQKLNNDSKLNYQLVIEGNAAINYKDKIEHTYDPDKKGAYLLSYKRALSLYLRWKSKGLDLRKYNTEIIIAGSGFNGINRARNEDYNKRFVVQIIPKVGRLNSN